MPVQVLQPRNTESAVDRLAKGLQIVQSIYGMKVDSAKIDALRKEESNKATQLAFDNEIKKAAADREAAKEKEFDDPNASLAQLARTEAKRVGLTVPENATYRQMQNAGLLDRVKEMQKHRNDLSLEGFKKRAEAGNNPEKLAFQRLPEPAKKEIEKIADKNASKKDIRNLLDSALESLEDPSIDEDMKVAIGNGLLKTLNSKQGADAIGNEESKRLASFLEYKIANFTRPGSFIGRDLDKFVEQVRHESRQLEKTIEKNNAEIDRLFGRSSGIAKVPENEKRPRKAEGLIPEALANEKGQPMVKEVGGALYQKVGNGWKRL